MIYPEWESKLRHPSSKTKSSNKFFKSFKLLTHVELHVVTQLWQFPTTMDFFLNRDSIKICNMVLLWCTSSLVVCNLAGWASQSEDLGPHGLSWVPHALRARHITEVVLLANLLLPGQFSTDIFSFHQGHISTQSPHSDCVTRCYFNLCLQQGSRDDRESCDVFSFLYV